MQQQCSCTVATDTLWADSSNEHMWRLHTKSNHAHRHGHKLTFPCTQNPCVNYFLHLAKAHLLFHYISDISVSVSGLWHGAEQIGPGKEASPKGGSVAQQGRTVIISSLNEFSLGK